MEDAIIDQELDDRVVKALNSDALGDTDDYFDLIQLLQSKDEPMVVAIFKTLKIAVASINRAKHHTLLQAISEISLWNCGPLVIKAACKFIVVLAKSERHCVEFSLDFLIKNFILPRNSLAHEPQVLHRLQRAVQEIIA